ncbi:MAG: hypothetical protein CMJ78_06075, partial [Planctomycetaceae bacterium]|nr:hypothetical protein [Planctomycetaceae bacterium]
MLETIANVQILGGSPLHIPLNASDAENQSLTFQASSDSADLTTFIPEGNRSIRMEVESFGNMTFELFEGRAPRATDQIVNLAESDFYDGSIFHRVINNFVIQGGDPVGNPPGTGGSALPDFDDQFHVDLQHNTTGQLSMAKTTDDTNNSQFFITEGAQRHLDYNHTIFGQMTEGESVRAAISDVAVNAVNNRPLVDVVVNSVEVFVDNENGVLMLKAPEGFSTETSPGSDVDNPITVTVTVTDTDGNEDTQTFQVTVRPDQINSNPFLEDIPAIQTLADTEITYQLSAIDAEGHTNALFLDENLLVANNQQNDMPRDENNQLILSPAELNYSINATSGLATITPVNGLTGTHPIVMSTGIFLGIVDYQVVPITIVGSASELTVSAADALFTNQADDGVADTFTVGQVGDVIETLVNDVVVSVTHRLSVSGITINGSTDDDSLVLDFTNGNPLLAGDITFNGGGQQTATGDTLTISGGSATSITHNFTNASDGSVVSDNFTVNYTGLEPIIDNTDVVDRVFVFAGSNDIVQLGDDGTANNGISRISSTGSSETVDFTNPTGSLTVRLGDGDDEITAAALDGQFAATVTIEGDGGADDLDVRQLGQGASLNGGIGDDILRGSGFDDVLVGAAGSDKLFGSNGDDQLSGGADDDTLNGQTGNDLIIESADVNYVLTGQVPVDGDGNPTGPINGQLTGLGTDRVTDVENAQLSGGISGNDIDVRGFDGRTTLFGNGGDDTLRGSVRPDELIGGAGDDKLFGSAGKDTLEGGAGDDTLNGQGDNDKLVESGDFNFTLTDTQMAGNGTDRVVDIERAEITAGASDNVLDASAFDGNVTLDGGDGNDTITGSPRRDSLVGGNGNDIITAGGGNDLLEGNLGDDTVDGGVGNDKLTETGGGDFTATDTSLIGAGTDQLISLEKLKITTGGGSQTIDATGFSGLTVLNAGDDDDILRGGSGVSILLGGAGDDELEGNDGNDKLFGGEGSDTISGGTDFDKLRGNEGGDVLAGGEGNDIIDGHEGHDTIDGDGGNDTIRGGDGNDTIRGGDGFDIIDGED